MRPRTGTLYSDDFSFEFARSSSAAPQSRRSKSPLFAGILFLDSFRMGVNRSST